MSKRKLNQQQRRRIANHQASQASTATHTGIVTAHFGSQVNIESGDEATITCQLRANLPALVCGDDITWLQNKDGSGTVTARLTRRSEFGRPDRRGQFRAIAANIDRVFLTLAQAPIATALQLDSLLCALNLVSLETVIVINKNDLAPQANFAPLQALLPYYQSIGYEVIHTSTRQDRGLDRLHAATRQHRCVFVGQSGVGKSSLIQALIPDASLTIGALSDTSQQGRHTTTTTRLYRIDPHTFILDSPGANDFALWTQDRAQIWQGFPDLQILAAECKFRNCQHRSEPQCAVQHAAQNNSALASRLNSFHQLCES